MIRVLALTGPYAGLMGVPDESVDPGVLLGGFAIRDWRWSVDFSQATEREAFLWARADMAARVSAALIHGRSVMFNDMTWRVADINNLQHVAGEVEDAIADSSYLVRVERDDEEGVVIGTGGTKHRIQ